MVAALTFVADAIRSSYALSMVHLPKGSRCLVPVAVLVAIGVTVSAGIPRAMARQGEVRLPDFITEWSSDPVSSDDVLSAYVSFPVGFRLAFFRLRWDAFHLELLSLGVIAHTVGRGIAAMQIWPLGAGAKVHFGVEGRHEIGFVAYVLGGSLYWGPPDKFGGGGDAKQPLELFRDPDAVAYLPTSVYYRYNVGYFHVEAGLNAPLVANWKNRLYAYFPPLEMYVGGGF